MLAHNIHGLQHSLASATPAWWSEQLSVVPSGVLIAAVIGLLLTLALLFTFWPALPSLFGPSSSARGGGGRASAEAGLNHAGDDAEASCSVEVLPWALPAAVLFEELFSALKFHETQYNSWSKAARVVEGKMRKEARSVLDLYNAYSQLPAPHLDAAKSLRRCIIWNDAVMWQENCRLPRNTNDQLAKLLNFVFEVEICGARHNQYEELCEPSCCLEDLATNPINERFLRLWEQVKDHDTCTTRCNPVIDDHDLCALAELYSSYAIKHDKHYYPETASLKNFHVLVSDAAGWDRLGGKVSGRYLSSFFEGLETRKVQIEMIESNRGGGWFSWLGF